MEPSLFGAVTNCFIRPSLLWSGECITFDLATSNVYTGGSMGDVYSLYVYAKQNFDSVSQINVSQIN